MTLILVNKFCLPLHQYFHSKLTNTQICPKFMSNSSDRKHQQQFRRLYYSYP